MPSTSSKLTTEFIGTFFLVFVIGLCVTRGILPGTTPPAIAIGVALTALVYMGGHVSGAHYNPAVTLAVFLRGKIDAAPAIMYAVTQLAGATIACLAVRGITGTPLTIAPGPGMAIHNAEAVSLHTALAVEAMCTFFLTLVVLNVATSKNTAGNSYYGLAIGGTVIACAAAAGGISGGAFNPAVGIGPAIASLLSGTGFPAHAWIYLVGPCLGAAAAAMVFRIQKQD